MGLKSSIMVYTRVVEICAVGRGGVGVGDGDVVVDPLHICYTQESIVEASCYIETESFTSTFVVAPNSSDVSC